jgi:hypothetical protein
MNFVTKKGEDKKSLMIKEKVNGSIGGSSEGSVVTSSYAILGKVQNYSDSYFGDGKDSIFMITLLLLSIIVGIIGIVGLRHHFAGHGLMLLKMRDTMSEVYNTDRHARHVFTTIGKCGAYQAMYNTPRKPNPVYSKFIKDTVTWMALTNGKTEQDSQLWIQLFEMDDDFMYHTAQLKRNIYDLENSITNVKKIVNDALEEESITFLYETFVDGFYYENFDHDSSV